MNVNLKLLSAVAAALVLMLSGAVHAETTIGRWCDKMLPTMPQYNGIMEIVITDSGAIELRTRYGDGSNVVSVLNEQSGGIYADVESTHCPSSNKWNRRSDYLVESFVPHYHITRRVVDSANDVSRWSFS